MLGFMNPNTNPPKQTRRHLDAGLVLPQVAGGEGGLRLQALVAQVRLQQ